VGYNSPAFLSISLCLKWPSHRAQPISCLNDPIKLRHIHSHILFQRWFLKVLYKIIRIFNSLFQGYSNQKRWIRFLKPLLKFCITNNFFNLYKSGKMFASGAGGMLFKPRPVKSPTRCQQLATVTTLVCGPWRKAAEMGTAHSCHPKSKGY